jgi:hypothetical protein
MPNPALIEIYEDRIARLEEGVTDCKVDLGIVKTQISDGVKMLSEKLDAVAVLSERVAVLEIKGQLAQQLKIQEEEIHAKTSARRSFRWKLVTGAITAAVAVIGLLLKIAFGG